jgi:hypothetical protein
MGKTKQQRRADRRRTRAASGGRQPHPDGSSTRASPAEPVDQWRSPTASGSDATGPAPTVTDGPAAGFWDRPRDGTRNRQARESRAAQAETLARNLIADGARVAFGHGTNDIELEDVVHSLVVGATAGDPPLPAGRVATDLLVMLVGASWECGWQPGDLAHIVRRHQPARIVPLAAAVMLEQARRERAAERAPADWVAQLESLPVVGPPTRATAAVRHGGVPSGDWSITDWQHEQGITPWDGWRDLLALIGQLQTLHRLTALGPVPSQWESHRAATAARAARHPRGDSSAAEGGPGHDIRMLSRIRALLAKAEATTFSEEADAFTTKAQDLMTRYAIDEALLDDSIDQVDVPARRIHIDNPYAEAKVQLLSTVGEINRVRVIWDGDHGMATAVGMLVDLQLVEMMFTSLLVQATREMTHAGNARTTAPGYQTGRVNRSPSFRRAFLLAYATRIGERLTEAGQRAGAEASSSHGADLVPLLARRTAAVDSAFARLFPQTREMRATRVNARGWDAGRAAADRAIFASGQVEAAG